MAGGRARSRSAQRRDEAQCSLAAEKVWWSMRDIMKRSWEAHLGVKSPNEGQVQKVEHGEQDESPVPNGLEEVGANL